jgi:hypothetical protein
MSLGEKADSEEVPEGVNIPDEFSQRTNRFAANC